MRIVLSLFFASFILSAFSQSTSASQKTLITKRTATWCPNCGTWGWDLAKGIEELNNPNAILIRAHYSGDLESQVADDITKNFNALYQPEFYINEDRQSVGSTNWSSMIAGFESTINENAGKEANVSFSLLSTVNEDTISTDVTVEVLNNVSGEYYLALYLLEDGVIANQASLGAETTHNSILRRSLSGESFGSQIFNGAADAGSSASTSQTLYLDGESLGNRNFRVLAIVWKKEGDSYLVENLHSTSVDQFSSTKSIAKLNTFVAFQAAGSLNLSFEMEEDSYNGKIQIHGIDGRKISSLSFDPRLGENEMSIPVNNLSGQIVILSVLGDDHLIHSQKVLIK